LHDNQFSEIRSSAFDGLESLDALDLGSNKLKGCVADVLGALWDSTTLRQLNVSYNEELALCGDSTWSPSLQLRVLDISGTNVTLRPEMCMAGISVFASGSGPLARGAGTVSSVVRICSQPGAAALLDISPSNASEIQSALAGRYEILGDSASDDGGGQLTFRLQTISQSPVQCGIRQGVRDIAQQVPVGQVLVPKPVLEYRCLCSPGYTPDTQGVCRKFWGAGRVAGLALGIAALAVASTLVATLACLRLWRRRRRLLMDLDLHRDLLQESECEVVALKRAWEIDWADVNLAARIDHAAEGAFGEVRRMCWAGPWPGRSCQS